MTCPCCPVLSLKRSLVAMEKVATATPLAVALISGSLPTFPRRITLLTLFAIIANHALHGDMIFPGHGTVRTVYLSILASHIVLSVVVLPMILTTFYFSLSGRFPQHKRLARFTFPIWLYVSVTGVVVYAMLASWR